MGESDSSDGPRDKKRFNNNGNPQDNSVVAQKVGTLDDGTAAFMQWLDLVNNQQYPTNSLDTSLILRKFIKDKQAILYDKNLRSKKAFHFVAIATYPIVPMSDSLYH
jgi:hypothetical protein